MSSMSDESLTVWKLLSPAKKNRVIEGPVMGAREPATGHVLFAENCIGARGPVFFAEYKFCQV